MADVHTPRESFRHLHECFCDATWDHSERGTTVRQADCLVCFQREMEPMERGIVRRTRIEDAKWTCAYCKYRKGDYQIHQWWHATARGDKWCNAQAIWNRIAEEGE
jgi:hypothetical protein